MTDFMDYSTQPWYDIAGRLTLCVISVCVFLVCCAVCRTYFTSDNDKREHMGESVVKISVPLWGQTCNLDEQRMAVEVHLEGETFRLVWTQQGCCFEATRRRATHATSSNV